MPMKPFQMAMVRKSYLIVNIRQGRDDAPEVLCAAFLFFERRIFFAEITSCFVVWNEYSTHECVLNAGFCGVCMEWLKLCERKSLHSRRKKLMKKSLKNILLLAAGMGLSLGFVAGCDDTDDGDSNGESFVVPEGYLSTCQPKQSGTTYCSKDDAKAGKVCSVADPKRSKKEAADYLAGICKLPEYYTTESFLNVSDAEQVFGSPCFCYGNGCEYMGYERPEVGGTPSYTDKGQLEMFGCNGVPETYQGAVRSCFRSSEVDGIKPAIYFPQGTCALAMSKCTTDPGDTHSSQTICSFAVFGDPKYGTKADNNAYDSMIGEFKTCPEGSNGVLIDFQMPISIEDLGAHAVLDIRACFQGCREDSDCHGTGVYDPIVQRQSNTRCLPVQNEDGTEKAGICFDPESVKDAKDFGHDGFKLVNAGNFKR